MAISEEASHDYQKTSWAPGMPITQERMTNIEDNVYINREAIQALDNDVNGQNGLASTVNATSSSIGTNPGDIYANKTLWQAVSTLNNMITSSTVDAAAGANAWTQIVGLIGKDTLGNLKQSLSEYMAQYSTEDTNIKRTLGVITSGGTESYAYDTTNTVYKAIKALNDALGYDAGGNPVFGTKDSENNIITVLSTMNDLTRNVSAVLDALSEAAPSPTYSSLANRLALMNTAINNATDALTLAKESSVYKTITDNIEGPTTYGSLDERLEHIETVLVDNTSNINTLSGNVNDNYVKKNEVRNDFTHSDTNLPLSALKGKELRDMIGGEYTASSTVASAISTAQSTAETNAQSYADTNKVDKTDIYNDVDYTEAGKVLDARQGTALKEAIDGANTLISGLRTDVNTIATELSMVNVAEEITGTTSRIDQLEANMVTMANEIGMLQDGAAVQDMASAITGNATRIDTLDSDLNTATTGIKDRVSALEGTINTAETGLSARMTAAEGLIDDLQGADVDLDARLDAIDGGNTFDTTNGTLAAHVAAVENAISHAASGNDAGGLTERITALETAPKSATVIIDNVTYNNDGIPTNISNPSTDVDYLLKNGDKYYYWKYIQTGSNPDTFTWALISGGGTGSGTSSAEFAATLQSIATPDENTDYFVGNNEDGYTHYRYVVTDNVGSFVRILPNNLIVDASLTRNGGLVAYTIADTNTNVFEGFVALKSIDYDTTESGTTLTFVDTNGTTTEFTVQGGGGSGSGYKVKLDNASGATTLVYPALDNVAAPVKVKPIVKEDGELLDPSQLIINITAQWSLDQEVWYNFYSGTGTNGSVTTINTASVVEKDVPTYIKVQMSTVIDDQERTSTSPIYTVRRVEMSIAAVNFDPATVRTGDLRFQYRPIGNGLTKIVHFLIDGVDAVTPVTTTKSNEVMNQTIPLSVIGAHSFQVYFTVEGVESNKLDYYILYNNDPTRVTPLLGLSAPETITYGDGLDIDYTVATPSSTNKVTERVVLELYTATESLKTIEYTNLEDEKPLTWSLTMNDYPIPEDDSHPVTVYVRGTAYNTVDGVEYSDSHTISIVITALDTGDFDINPEGQEYLVYSYTAYGKTNNDADRDQYHWTYTAHDDHNTEIEWTGAFTGFNWATNGYIGDQALTISGGAVHTVNVPIFSSSYNNITLEYGNYTNPAQNGRTIEIEYEVQSATNLNDVIIECFEGGNTHRGFRITPQSCYLLNSSTDISIANDGTGNILNESSVAAAYLSPNGRNHLVFVIEPWATEKTPAGSVEAKYRQSANIYLNGEFVNACPYAIDNNSRTVVDDFTTSATLRIGSASCIIKLYNIRMYNRGLSQTQILHNYETIPATTAEKLNRYEYNDVLDDNGAVNYEKARKHFTCLLLKGPDPVWAENEQHQRYNSMPTISPYKGAPSPIGRRDKTGEVVGKTESGLTLTIPDSSVQGYKVEFDLQDKLTDGGYASSNNVQGTSSQKYPVHNLKVYLAKGDPSTAVLDENDVLIGYTKSTKVKYKIPGSKGKESTLCWKADYMSTDHANTYNANIADSLFSQSLNPDITDEEWQTKVQNTVNGIRCLLFEQNGNATPIFVGDGCLNNDKGNSKTYGLEYPEPEDPAEIDPNAEYDVDGTADTVAQKWEFTNNSDDLGFFKYDSLFHPTGEDNHYHAKDAFESCYPDQGDLEDAQDAYKEAHDNVEDPNLNPNYNHLQVLLTWVSQRANYWMESDPDIRATKKAIFKSEFTQHFNLDHTLVYYLFSEYVALCDNRAKNMFLRSDTVRKEVLKLKDGSTLFSGNSNPNADFWKEFTQIDTGEVDSTGNPIYKYKVKNENQIDWAASTFAIWAPVLYDLDSCFGVENVGLLKIPYDADWQYQDNDSYLFNGHDSIFWLMFEDSFDTEIRAKALTLYNRERGLNYNTFYQEQIVGNQNETAPAMVNQDMILKFDIPWATGFMNYAEKPPVYQIPEYKYLQRGTRAAQKRQFISQRSMLLSSKYSANEFTNGRISMRYGTDLAAADAVLEITGNQNFYPAASFGDNKGWTRSLILKNGTAVTDGLVKANETCIIRSTSSIGGQDTLFIGGAKVLTDVGDLSPFKPYEIKLGGAVNLKRLIFGSDAPGYTNTRTGEAGIEGLSACSLLEEINIQNCISNDLTSLDLSSNGLIKKVYTKGSRIKYVSLPAGGVLEELELSSSVENITVRNQNHLTTFVYQDSNINNYSNVNKLWVEGTKAVPIVDIITKNMSGLTNGVRLIDIDVDLGSNPFFLETITSDIAKGKYLDSSGSKITSIEYPAITGKVKISQIRQSLLTKIKQHYPNLIIYAAVDNNGNPIEINGANIINEFDIEYYNYNGTALLYTDHRTDQEHYIDPVSTYEDDLDPVTNMARIPMPTKPEDAQYYYTFGEYEDDGEGNLTYIRFSGWKKEGADTNPSADDYVSGNTKFIAQFPTTTDRYYTVNWYAEPNETSLNSIRAKYGTDITLYTQPEESTTLFPINKRVKTDSATGITKVFKGWDRPVGKLTEDTNIYALWETSSIGNSIQSVNMSELNAADLYAISNLGSAAKIRILDSKLQGADPIAVRMGNDFYYTSGVNTTDLLDGAEKLTLTGSSTRVYVKNSITPLANLASDWTLAIDYKFLMDSSAYASGREFVLLSCYKNADSAVQGFKVSLTKGSSTSDQNMYVHVTWGTTTTSTAIDTVTLTGEITAKQYCKTNRNVIVLRHLANEPQNLYIYYTGFSGRTYNYSITNAVSTSLSWNSRTAISTPLIIGGNYSGATQSIEATTTRRPAKAIVYWGKFWDTDLGAKNCRALAAWPHETEYFVLTGYDNNQSETEGNSTRIISGTKLSFAAVEGFGDRELVTPEVSGSYYGWAYSSLRTFCENRIYNAFPITYRSIINAYNISSNYFDPSSSSDNGEELATTTDHIYIPCEKEVSTRNVGTTNKDDEALRFWPWLSTSNINALVMSNDVLVDATIPNINPLLYRFIARASTTDNRIFYNTTDPSATSTWIYQKPGQADQEISVQSGDIWYTDDANVNSQFSGSANAYIYYTDAEINEGVYVDIITAEGGWKRAGMWELRTYYIADGTLVGNAARFEKVNESGTIIYPANNNAANSSTRILCPEFSI